MLQFYKSLIRPHLEYCTDASSPHYVKDKELLEWIQCRFSRMIPKLSILSVWRGWTCGPSKKEEYEPTNLLKSIGLRCLMVYLRYSLIPCLPSIDLVKRTRGHSFKLIKNRVHSNLQQHFFSKRVIKFWNSLDDSTVSANCLNSFKHRLGQERNILQMVKLRTVWCPTNPRGRASLVRPRPVIGTTSLYSDCSRIGSDKSKERLAINEDITHQTRPHRTGSASRIIGHQTVLRLTTCRPNIFLSLWLSSY